MKLISLSNNVKDIKNTFACFASSLTTIIEFYYNCQPLSINFIYGYYNNIINKGLDIKTTLNLIKEIGVCYEQDCPGIYEQPKAHQMFLKYYNNINIKNNYKINDFLIITNISNDTIKNFINKNQPIIAIIKVPIKYSLDNNYNLTFTSIFKNNYHSIVIYGYDNIGYWCRNCYGKSWGKNGNFRLEYKNIKLIQALIFISI